MNSLARQIEQYIKELMEQQQLEVLEIQRNLLSAQFHCVPSQINYVLSTRFTPAHGYMVESRRGGGGFVRIVSLPLSNDEDLYRLIAETLGEEISEAKAEGLLQYLVNEEVLTEREGTFLVAMLKDRVLLGEKETKGVLRANLLQHALMSLLRDE